MRLAREIHKLALEHARCLAEILLVRRKARTMTATQRVEKTKGLQRALEARGTERASREALACAWEHRALVARTIRRCLHHKNQISLEMDDLITIGVMGIARGIETYDPERGAFSTYISHWVYQSITRAIDVQGQTVRRPTYLNEVERKRAKDPDTKVTEAAAYAVDTRWAPIYSLHATKVVRGGDDGLALEEVLPAPQPSADELLDAEHKRQRVRAAIAKLNPRERLIIERRFDEEMTLSEVGRDMTDSYNYNGITRERVRQIEQGALRKLRSLLAEEDQ